MPNSSEKKQSSAKKIGLGILIVSALLAIIFLRRPDALLHPQFWAEDGRVWYANAYNFGGFRSLFLTQDGYFQTFSRLVAALAQAFPLWRGPLVFNLAAILVQLLPALFIISSRFKNLIPSFYARVAIALLYLLIPNSAEISGNLTNSQWFLALLACLVILANEGTALFWNIFDAAVLLLSGLSGPFSILLAPVAFLKWLAARTKKSFWNLLIVFATACAQLAGLLLLSRVHRVSSLPIVSLPLGLKILGKQVVLGLLLGKNGTTWTFQNIPWHMGLLVVAIMLSLMLLAYASFKSPLALRLFIFFSIIIFAASLLSPTTGAGAAGAWSVLYEKMDGVRYWLLPMLSFLAILIWALGQKEFFAMKFIAGLLLATMAIGIVVDFNHPAFTDFQFKTYANKFEASKKGTVTYIPINPPGWGMALVKK